MSSEPLQAIKIDDKWISVASFKKVHPGGAKIIESCVGHDATEAFYALHSQDAISMMESFKDISSKVPASYEAAAATDISDLTRDFRRLRASLLAEGVFDRDYLQDLKLSSIIVALAATGTALAWSYPVVATVLIALALQQAGWLGHDYQHGRGRFCKSLDWFFAIGIAGFSCRWWSAKHNTHHVFTNTHEDLDIANDPVLHLFIPEKEEDDFWARRYQHYYYHMAYAFLYFSWSMQSIMFAWANKLYFELAILALHYTWFACLPLNVALGSILLGGWLVAEVVTATHQSEEIIDGVSHDFVGVQYRTTRDVVMDSSVMNWLWGGMQHQLVHHLFPTLPRYKYSQVTPRIAALAKKHGVEYRTASMSEILVMNYETMRLFSLPVGTKAHLSRFVPPTTLQSQAAKST
eukprot:CAMPEP_0170740748 /NCGR_PEP_ID=MMETSP0437-20130122/5844_1 /TAXON_ID=0 /ORGANISM="Sexangularia sp." /LENGTH=406 /DNA_ID=CAMNT_0011079259 /DNA_START=32 /DNA_END=1252 /DNA_ORIENTATION=-